MKQNNIEKELNAIRLSLYEEIKGMTPSEMTFYMKSKVESVEKKHDIHPIDHAKPIERKPAL